MAKRKPNGEYTGLTGGLVLYESNGVGIMRGRPKKRKDKSALLKTVRTDFGYVVDRVKDLKTVIDIGFKDFKTNRAAYHSAISVNMNNYKEALRLNKTNNIEWLQVSAGKLSGAETAASSRLENGMIEITWQGTEPGRRNFDTDRVITGIYQKSKGSCLSGPEGITRKDGKIILNPQKLFKGELMDVFIFFKAEGKNYKKNSESNVSVSQWVGQYML